MGMQPVQHPHLRQAYPFCVRQPVQRVHIDLKQSKQEVPTDIFPLLRLRSPGPQHATLIQNLKRAISGVHARAGCARKLAPAAILARAGSIRKTASRPWRRQAPAVGTATMKEPATRLPSRTNTPAVRQARKSPVSGNRGPHTGSARQPGPSPAPPARGHPAGETPSVCRRRHGPLRQSSRRPAPRLPECPP